MEHYRWTQGMRLRRPQDFRHVWSTGRSWAYSLFILWAAPNALDHTRIGITASRKVGNAVARNRARRLLREAARLCYPHVVEGWDLVFVARAYLVQAKSSQVLIDVEKALRRANLWDEACDSHRASCGRAQSQTEGSLSAPALDKAALNKVQGTS